MQNAILDAGIRPDQVDYINAHGTSTPSNDRLETLAIKRLFGEHARTLAISSTGQTLVVVIPGQACTGGGGACSSADPNSVSINFVLSNDPGYQTGTYSAQLTFTISAT